MRPILTMLSQHPDTIFFPEGVITTGITVDDAYLTYLSFPWTHALTLWI